VLAAVWLAGSAWGLVFGLINANWALVIASLFAFVFGALWSAVAWRGRLLGAGTVRSRQSRE
jgi:hypothetical protein